MTESKFSIEVAQKLVSSGEQFPVDFDQAFLWLEYTRRDNAKVNFMKCDFIEGVDYQILKSQELRPQGGYSNRETIRLTIDCFKTWGMMTGTNKGKEVRKYFIECEKLLKEIVEDKDHVHLAQLVQKYARIYKPEFQEEFWTQLYRVTGYKRPKRGHNLALAGIIRSYVYGLFPSNMLEELDKLNPITSYTSYEVPKASDEELKSLKAKMQGQKAAATMYTKGGKLAKAKQAKRRAEILQNRYNRMKKPTTIKVGKRDYCFHQFCSDMVGLPSLQQHLQSMIQVMRTLPNDDVDRFYEAMDSAFQGVAIVNSDRIILDLPSHQPKLR